MRGIYIFYCIKNKRYWIGASSTVNEVYQRLLTKLARRTTPKLMIQLQKDWDKYKPTDFKFWVLEYTDDLEAAKELYTKCTTRNRYNILLYATPEPNKVYRSHYGKFLKRSLTPAEVYNLYQTLVQDRFVPILVVALLFETSPSIISLIIKRQYGSKHTKNLPDIVTYGRYPL